MEGMFQQVRDGAPDGIAPMRSVADMTWPRRADMVDDGGKAGDVLANATEPEKTSDGGFYTVPKVVE